MERTHQDLCRFKSRDGALYKAVISDIKEILKPKKEDSPHGARGSVVYNNDYTNAKVGQSNMVGEVSGGDLNLGTGSTFNFN